MVQRDVVFMVHNYFQAFGAMICRWFNVLGCFSICTMFKQQQWFLSPNELTGLGSIIDQSAVHFMGVVPQDAIIVDGIRHSAFCSSEPLASSSAPLKRRGDGSMNLSRRFARMQVNLCRKRYGRQGKKEQTPT